MIDWLLVEGILLDERFDHDTHDSMTPPSRHPVMQWEHEGNIPT